MGVTLKGILQAVAPILADLLPGPLGGAVRKVIGETISKPGASDQEIEKALADANPELLLKLKQAQDDFVLAMSQKGIDLEKIAAEDRASARGMQIQTKSKTPAVLAGVVVVGWLTLMCFLMRGEIPTQNRDIVIQAVGTMGGALMLVLGFYFGSSSASQKKDETIKSLSNGNGK